MASAINKVMLVHNVFSIKNPAKVLFVVLRHRNSSHPPLNSKTHYVRKQLNGFTKELLVMLLLSLLADVVS
jgi:hypothetical protein